MFYFNVVLLELSKISHQKVMAKLKMPTLQHRKVTSTKKGEVKFLRVFFLISGIGLSTLLYCIEDSRNYCIWLTMYSLNILAASMAFIQPKCIGKLIIHFFFGYYIQIF